MFSNLYLLGDSHIKTRSHAYLVALNPLTDPLLAGVAGSNRLPGAPGNLALVEVEAPTFQTLTCLQVVPSWSVPYFCFYFLRFLISLNGDMI